LGLWGFAFFDIHSQLLWIGKSVASRGTPSMARSSSLSIQLPFKKAHLLYHFFLRGNWIQSEGASCAGEALGSHTLPNPKRLGISVNFAFGKSADKVKIG
jgi:hypothetical protein